MHDFRTVQTTTIVGGGKQFSNSKSHIREENDDENLHTTRRRSVTSLSEVYKMSEVCKITRTIQNRFDMGGTYRKLTRCVDGEKELSLIHI